MSEEEEGAVLGVLRVTGVLEASEEQFHGSEASSQSGAALTWWDLTLSQEVTGNGVPHPRSGAGPWVPVLSLHALLCGLGPVPAPLRASVSPPQAQRC